MNRFDPRRLLDLPRYPEHGYARLADRLRHLLATSADILFVQAEAVFALEAVATSLARPGLTAVNVVTSRYGRWFGAWLRRGGVSVHDVTAAPGQAIALGAVEARADELARVDIVAAVHAESSSGALNPIAGLAALARARDALFAVNAVASVGGHALELDALGIDVAVIGPQKALAGPAGVSAVAVGARAWAQIEAAPDSRRPRCRWPHCAAAGCSAIAACCRVRRPRSSSGRWRPRSTASRPRVSRGWWRATRRPRARAAPRCARSACRRGSRTTTPPRRSSPPRRCRPAWTRWR
ncbi:aminotransferase class V-fold PLP-dependent enzyme [Burkholderia glumae]|uniref:aminotransferase class V-fold PLP-dependent enzyme n=1 Tax=Burkholderia glumae TaxID=337 RepID=UPI003B99E682